jgi:hypothetical protein
MVWIRGFETNPTYVHIARERLKGLTSGHDGSDFVVADAVMLSIHAWPRLTRDKTAAISFLKTVKDNALPGRIVGYQSIPEWNGIWIAGVLGDADFPCSWEHMGAGLTPALALCDCALRIHLDWISRGCPDARAWGYPDARAC